MYCKFCGNEIADGVKFCPKCGAATETTSAPTVDEVFTTEFTATPTVDPAAEQAKNSRANKSLVFGILSLVFGSIVGLIFAILGIKNAKAYAALNRGIVEGKAKVGKILSTIGIPVAIITFIYNIFISAAMTEMINELMNQM